MSSVPARALEAERRRSVAGRSRDFSDIRAGLSTLFFTEMWERFSYYGMRAMLILFMTAPHRPASGSASTSASPGAIYGLYTSMVHMTTSAGRLDRQIA